MRRAAPTSMTATLPTALFAALLAPLLAMGAASRASAGVEHHNQYRSHGPTRYVVAVFDVLQDGDQVRVVKRTFKWKPKDTFSQNETGVLPGESYGPIAVDKSVNHLSWAGSYWRQDGAYEGENYVVELEEGKALGPIEGDTYKVEVTFKLVKRKPLMQPVLGKAPPAPGT